jgi:hypothetical protein
MDSELRHESEDFFVSLREHPSPNLWQEQEEVRELFGHAGIEAFDQISMRFVG